MRTKFFKKSLFCYILILALLLVSCFFSLAPKDKAHATEGRLTITGPDIVYTDSFNFKLTATLKGSQVFTAKDIAWRFESAWDSTTEISSNVGVEVYNSIATIPRLRYPSEGFKVAKVSAFIMHGEQELYTSSIEILFLENTQSNIILTSNITSQDYNSLGTYAPFNLTLPAQYNPDNLLVVWMILDSNGKYVEQGQTSTNNFSFTPEDSGIYTIKAKVGNKFSQPLDLIVKYAPLPQRLQVSHTLYKESPHALHSYLFKVDNIDELHHDVKNINWYRKGHSTPLQYGGKTFLFEPTAYATYQIYAKYGAPNDTSPQSNPEDGFLEIKIDRTKEIFLYVSGLVVILGIGLIFLIRRNIRRDSIW